MRFSDDDKTGCYCDAVTHRVEKTKDGREIAMCDLSLRIQPLTPEMAVAIDPKVRAALFALTDATERPEVKSLTFNLPVTRQKLLVYLLPEADMAQIALSDVEISSLRARTEKGVSGFGFCFDASFGPVGKEELEYVVAWLTQQRFVTFQPQEPALDFAGASEPDVERDTNVARMTPRRHPKTAPVEAAAEPVQQTNG